MAKTDPTMKVDIKGQLCPVPLTWAKGMLKTLNPGDTLEVLSTDPSTVSNFQAFARATGHELVEWQEEESGQFRLLIRKAAPDG